VVARPSGYDVIREADRDQRDVVAYALRLRLEDDHDSLGHRVSTRSTPLIKRSHSAEVCRCASDTQALRWSGLTRIAAWSPSIVATRRTATTSAIPCRAGRARSRRGEQRAAADGVGEPEFPQGLGGSSGVLGRYLTTIHWLMAIIDLGGVDAARTRQLFHAARAGANLAAVRGRLHAVE